MAGTIQQAIEHHRSGRLAEAESIYLELLRTQPNHVDALHYLGVLRVGQGKRAEAIELLKRSLNLAPRNPDAWNSLANMLLVLDPKAAEIAYTNATNLRPGFAEAWYNFGNLLRDQHRPHDALHCYRRVLDLKPRISGAYETIARFATGRSDIAVEAYRLWLEAEPDNPVARHMLAAHLGQGTPQRADDAYIVDIFDRAAGGFDSVLAKLEYAAPNLLTAALARVIAMDQPAHVILDAGCGTGLCGPLLRSSARQLIGVDLSAGMLVKARERKVYDELHQSELVAFMRAHPATYDVVISADTLVYFGALEEAMSAAAGALKPGGVLAFTVEAEPAESTGKFRMHSSGRYSHGTQYIRDCLTAAKLNVLQIEPAVLRKEGGADVLGYVVLGSFTVS
jgi:predicted TPR repeat methyltransferase